MVVSGSWRASSPERAPDGVRDTSEGASARPPQDCGSLRPSHRCGRRVDAELSRSQPTQAAQAGQEPSPANEAHGTQTSRGRVRARVDGMVLHRTFDESSPVKVGAAARTGEPPRATGELGRPTWGSTRRVDSARARRWIRIGATTPRRRRRAPAVRSSDDDAAANLGARLQRRPESDS